MKYRYTKNQVARGTRADAEKNNIFYLIKFVSSLRLTYQIQLLTLRAVEQKRKLLIEVPQICTLHPTLRSFVNDHPRVVRIERVKV